MSRKFQFDERVWVYRLRELSRPHAKPPRLRLVVVRRFSGGYERYVRHAGPIRREVVWESLEGKGKRWPGCRLRPVKLQVRRRIQKG